MLINVPRLVTAYYTGRRDSIRCPAQRFAARPSGTESIYKIYAESFKDQAHLDAIVSEAEAMVSNALESSDPNRGPRPARR